MNKQTIFILYIIVLVGAFFIGPRLFKSKSAPPPPAAVLVSQAQALCAQGKFQPAIDKYEEIAKTYRGTPTAAEAIYAEAQIYAHDVHWSANDSNALQLLNKLNSDYAQVDYPHKASVPADREALSRTLDYFYSHSNRVYAFVPYKDLYALMNFFVNLTGARSYSYWVALLLISVLVRVGLTPLTIKQYKGMREMQRLQPLVKEVQEKYKNNKEVLGQKTMELYREHKVNPAAGCVPMLIQMPVFYIMYMAVRVYQYHFTHGTFLWIGSALSHRVTSIFGISPFFAANLGEQDIPLLLLYSVSMYVTQRMMPASDPAQAEMQKTTALMTSVLFFYFFMSSHFASAFVLYWLISNIISTATQLYFMRGGKFAPAGVTPALPSDGGPGGISPFRPNVNVLSGNGSAKALPSSNGFSSGQGPEGTSRGVIAPNIHPKKKKR